MLKSVKVLFFCLMLAFSGCESEDPTTSTGGNNGGGSGSGSGSGSLSNTTWSRGSTTNTYLKFTSSSVTKCMNGNVIATGTFTSTSMTFVVPNGGGAKLTFPLQFRSGSLVVGVPAGYENDYDPETYYPSTTYPCDGGGGTGENISGYNCENGDCVYVTNGAKYSTKSACQNACSSGDNCPPTGKFSVKIYKPTGACNADDIRHSLRFYTCCEHGKSTDMVYVGMWSSGKDAGGNYITCLFGDEKQGVCAHGTTVANRLYKLEWEVTPKKGSYPNTCIKSGVANIDFNSQIKNVIIDWN